MKKLLSLTMAVAMGVLALAGSAAAQDDRFDYLESSLISDPILIANYHGSEDNMIKSLFKRMLPLVSEDEVFELSTLNNYILNTDMSFVMSNDVGYFVVKMSEGRYEALLEIVESYEALDRIDVGGMTAVTPFNRDDFVALYKDGALLMAESMYDLETVLENIDGREYELFEDVANGSQFSMVIDYDQLDSDFLEWELGISTELSGSQVLSWVEEQEDHFRIEVITNGDKSSFDEMDFSYRDFVFEPTIYKRMPAEGAILYFELYNLSALVEEIVMMMGEEAEEEFNAFKAEYGDYLGLFDDRVAMALAMPDLGFVPEITMASELDPGDESVARDLNSLIFDAIEQEREWADSFSFDYSSYCAILRDELDDVNGEINFREDPNSGAVGISEDNPIYGYYSVLSVDELKDEALYLEEAIDADCDDGEVEEEAEEESEKEVKVVQDFNKDNITDLMGFDEDVAEVYLSYGIWEGFYMISSNPNITEDFNSGESFAQNAEFNASLSDVLRGDDTLSIAYFDVGVVGDYMQRGFDFVVGEFSDQDLEDPFVEDGMDVAQRVIDYVKALDPWYEYVVAEGHYKAVDKSHIHLPVSDMITLILDGVDNYGLAKESSTDFYVETTFSDVDLAEDDEWEDEDVVEAVAQQARRGVVTGSEGELKPDDYATRVEFLAMLIRHLGLANPGNCDASELYDDVPDGAWYEETVCIAAAHGLISKDQDNVRAEELITKSEVAQVVFNFSGVAAGTGGDDVVLSDVAPNAWYSEASFQVVSNQLMSADGGRFDPSAPVSRLDIVILIDTLESREVRVFSDFDELVDDLFYEYNEPSYYEGFEEPVYLEGF